MHWTRRRGMASGTGIDSERSTPKHSHRHHSSRHHDCCRGGADCVAWCRRSEAGSTRADGVDCCRGTGGSGRSFCRGAGHGIPLPVSRADRASPVADRVLRSAQSVLDRGVGAVPSRSASRISCGAFSDLVLGYWRGGELRRPSSARTCRGWLFPRAFHLSAFGSYRHTASATARKLDRGWAIGPERGTSSGLSDV